MSLCELPDASVRHLMLANLWQHTGEYLVLVEMGNAQGFALIMEAREMLLEMAAEESLEQTHQRNKAGEIVLQVRLGSICIACLLGLFVCRVEGVYRRWTIAVPKMVSPALPVYSPSLT